MDEEGSVVGNCWQLWTIVDNCGRMLDTWSRQVVAVGDYMVIHVLNECSSRMRRYHGPFVVEEKTFRRFLCQ